MKKMHLAALASIGTFGMVATASAAHIDLFQTEGFSVTSANVLDPATETDTLTAGTPGDASTRTVGLTAIAGGPASFVSTGDPAVGAQYTGASGSVGVAVFTYTDFAMPGGSDFLNIRDGAGTDLGPDWTRIDFTFEDLENLQIIASLVDADGTEFDAPISPVIGTGDGNTDVFSINYSDFVLDAVTTSMNAGDMTLDLENIAEFSFSFGIPSFDQNAPGGAQSFRLVDVRRAGQVPVPASLLLLVAGLGGLVARRKLAA